MIRALVVLALAATPLWAQVPVRGGEHEGFTRLALSLPRPGGWSILPTGEGWEVRVEEGAEFDLTDTWARIGRSRIAAVASGGAGRLTIIAACDCDLAATEHPGPILALDVGPALDDVERPPLVAGDAAEVVPAGEADERGGRSLPRLPLLPRFALPAPPARAARPVPLREVEPDALRAALAGALSVGVDRGLLQPAADPPPLPDRIDRPEDAGTLRLDPRTAPAPVPADCPEDGTLTLAPRAAPAPLYGEFDRIDPVAALDVARRALASGLAEEAEAILLLLEEGSERDALMAVTASLTRGTPPGWSDCASNLALWDAVSGTLPDQPPGEVAASALDLPPGLAAVAIPSAARTLVRAGPAGHRAATRMIRTLPEKDRDPAAALVAALLEEGQARLDRLRPLALGSTPQAVEAATFYLLERDADVEVTDAAMRLASERPDDPARGGLMAAAVGAALAQGRPDAALEALSPDDAPAAWNLVARHLVEAPAPEMVRLSRTWAEPIAEADLDPALRARIEARLIEAGWGPAPAPAPPREAMPAVVPAPPDAPPPMPAGPPGETAVEPVAERPAAAAAAARMAVENADRALASVRALLDGD